MPFCEPCDRFYNPNSLNPDGTCPRCHIKLAEPPTETKVPWHFWVLLAALVVYLGWRLIQGVGWLL